MNEKFSATHTKAKKYWEELQQSSIPQIIVGTATCGCAAGALEVIKAIEGRLLEKNITASVRQVGCIGMCYAEVLVDIIKSGRPRISYKNVTPEKAVALIDDYLLNDNPRVDLALGVFGDLEVQGIPLLTELPVFSSQQRVVLKNCGIIDPGNIDEYIAQDGYLGLVKCMSKSQSEILDIIKKSGLRGRGGAGFPTGKKWESCLRVASDQKYVICNADEGDPGAFMDRSVLEGDPHALLEGMLIAAYTIGASKGFIYVRAEYPLAITRLKDAIAQAKSRNLLGENILGSNFSFDLEIFQGAGAFVCGESTALVRSIEGFRGMPKPLPRPRTTEEGLWGKPTLLNNVKTFAIAPQIINKGAEWFASIGSEKCSGTAVFALAGNIVRSGLIEVPMGIQLDKIIYEIGGGVLNNRTFKAVQTGGPSGGCLPADLLNLEVDFDSLLNAGTMMGSGGMVVMDDSSCMVDIARYFLEFTVDESCGQCAPCRAGTDQMLKILNDITHGRGRQEDLALLEELGRSIIAGSICGLGQSAPNPALSTLRYFRSEYEAHINHKSCPALQCKELIIYWIDPEKCTACGRCLKECPTLAITGDKKIAHVIEQDKCIKCGICLESCPVKVNAIIKLTGDSKTKILEGVN
ncbi:MAG TPA: NADH-quinone oxidoreductase subunit NuoF [Candidatus Limnocylindrales bacterium]|nr:NADH-quinone oxidoreductase subunit NuoF [Candidatus Limnocylindrales bacterium]